VSANLYSFYVRKIAELKLKIADLLFVFGFVSCMIFYMHAVGQQIKERSTIGASPQLAHHAFINFSGGVIIEHQQRAVCCLMWRGE
jgi:hypothetical protein